MSSASDWTRRKRGAVGARAVLTASVALVMPAAALAQTVLAPHRAVYEMSLDRAKGGSSISALTGRMVYELTGSSCEGYTQKMRFVTRMSSQDGQTTLSDMRSTGSEDAAWKRFRFSSSQYKDEKLAEQVAGEAERTDNAIVVQISRPKKAEHKLSAAAMFPIQHSIALLEAAKAGKTLFTTDLYDGSEKGDKLYATTAVIGRRLPPGENAKLAPVANAKPLDALASWPISLSYFEKSKEKEDAVPTYELAFLYFENGVSRRLRIDYGEFSVRGTLKDITFLEVAKCDRKP